MTVERSERSFVSQFNWGERSRDTSKKEAGKRQERKRKVTRAASASHCLAIPSIEDVIMYGVGEDKHHIFSRPFLKDHIDDMRDWEKLRGKKIHVSHLAHALLHHAAYYCYGYPTDLTAYMGQVSHISSVDQMDIYLHYSEDIKFLEAWGDPYYVMRRCKRVIFFSEK